MANDTSNDQQADEVDDEQSSTEDQADDEGTGVEEDAADSEEADDEGDDATGDDESDELIDDAKFNALKDDPAALRKELQGAATKKFQKLSERRKAIEPYADFITAYERDPKGAAIALARNLGVKIEDVDTTAAGDKAVKKISDLVKEKLTAKLGTGYEDLAEGIADAVEAAAKQVVEAELKPIKDGQNALIKDSASREASDAILAFEKRNPNWRKHEPEMVKLMKKFPPSEGISESEYLDGILHLATRDTKVGDKVKKTIDKMTENVRRSEGKSRTVNDKTVTKGPSGKLPSFRESAAAADRGERFE